jgi:hypothetical protein
MYIAGPVMEGPPATMPLMPVFNSPEAARKSVAWQAAQGYDFVKVYDQLSEETYRENLNAAQEHGLPVIGHTPKKVGLEAVLAGGQISIEHLTGYIDPDAADFAIPEDELAHYAEMTREAGVWNCPTIGIYQKLVPDEHLKEYDRQPGMAYVSPRTRALWMLFLRGSRGNITYKGSDYPSRIAEIYTRMTRALHDAGRGSFLAPTQITLMSFLGFHFTTNWSIWYRPGSLPLRPSRPAPATPPKRWGRSMNSAPSAPGNGPI